MTTVSIGDLARNFQLRRHNTELQTRLSTLTQEMTTGERADIGAAVSGDFKALAGLDHSLRLLDGYRTAASEAALFAEGLQRVLGAVQSLSQDIAPSLLNAGTIGSAQMVETATVDARQKFQSAVSSLNTQIADRFLLSGTATDREPISGAGDILDALSTITAGLATASDVIAAVQSWFDAPPGTGGFAATVYGGAAPQSAADIGANDSVVLDITALDPAIRDTLKGLALAALVADGALAGDAAGRALVTRTAGETMLGAGSGLTTLSARVGSAEAHIAESASRTAAEAGSLAIARSALVAADPYATATALQSAQTQLETLYSITARLSRLSLADFLR
jgi:flagellar hook-associated protein 3 FlgL